MDQEKSFRLLRLFALIPILFGPAIVHAHQGVGVLAADSTVYENQADSNSGGDSQVCVGNIATTDTRQAFVRYTLPSIEPGSTIYRVVWTLSQEQVHSEGGGPLAANLQVRRVTASWAEGSGSAVGGNPCDGGENAPGVDWSSQPAVAAATSATAALSAGSPVSVVIDTADGDEGLMNDVQAWFDNGATNFGWRLAVVEDGTADNARVLVPGTLTIYWNVAGEDTLFADGFESP